MYPALPESQDIKQIKCIRYIFLYGIFQAGESSILFQTHLGFGKVQICSRWPADVPLHRRGSIKIIFCV